MPGFQGGDLGQKSGKKWVVRKDGSVNLWATEFTAQPSELDFTSHEALKELGDLLVQGWVVHSSCGNSKSPGQANLLAWQ